MIFFPGLVLSNGRYLIPLRFDDKIFPLRPLEDAFSALKGCQARYFRWNAISALHTLGPFSQYKIDLYNISTESVTDLD